jgi:hypothetical protein
MGEEKNNTGKAAAEYLRLNNHMHERVPGSKQIVCGICIS